MSVASAAARHASVRFPWESPSGFAVALAWENKRLLLGESLPAEEERRLRAIVREYDDVESIVDFRTVYFGPENVVVAADIAFQPGIATVAMDERITEIEDLLTEANPDINKVYIEPE
jgi:divalent metal cation (Fe/Co/Zn/Cd) transporter